MANFNLADYETVDSRIHKFYTDNPTGRIITDLVESAGEVGKTRWVVKASVWRSPFYDRDMTLPASVPDGTGWAFENDGEGMANRTSALENCETSAIGRALANIGYSGDKRASREEMKKAADPEVPAKAATPPEGWRAKLAAVPDLDSLQDFYADSAHLWFTDEVKLAFKARKTKLVADSAAVSS